MLQTDWEGGYFPLTLNFSEENPSKPPECKLPNGFFHPNVYPSGIVCLSILSERCGWRPSITVKQILVGIQDLLDQPNATDIAQTEGHQLYVSAKVIGGTKGAKAIGGTNLIIWSVGGWGGEGEGKKERRGKKEKEGKKRKGE
ncbi:hypothetical protein Gotur_005716 [Gossypium turneri]